MMEKYNFTKKIVDEWDPIGLLAMGCPDDEYSPEIVDIVKLLPQMQSVEELASGIREVFLEWFGEHLPIEKCLPVAEKIWNKD